MPKFTIDLTVADFNLKVVLHKTKYELTRIKLFKSLLKNLSGFLSKNDKSNNIDCTINVYEYRNVGILSNKTSKKQYIFLYKIEKNNTISTIYSDLSQFRFLLKEVVTILLRKHGGLVLHTSAVKLGDKALLFTGFSNAGKTTIARLLKKEYQSVESDTGIIRVIGGQVYFYQTPLYCLLNKKKNYKRLILKNIYFLYKSNKFIIKPLMKKQLILEKISKHLMQNIAYSAKQFNSILCLVNKVNFSKLYFAKKSKRVIELIKSHN